LKDPSHIINEYHAHTEVFDSPGCKEMLLQMESDFDIRSNVLSAGRSIFINNLDITSYLSAPNKINTSNQHLGKVYRIFVDLSDWNSNIFYDKATHSMDRILNAFKDFNLKIVDVIDWPIRKGLSGIELDSFFQWANKLNNYNPEKLTEEYPGYSAIRYQTKPFNEQECSINIFTQSEQEFLRNYQVVRDYVELYELENFFNSIQEPKSQNYAQTMLKTYEIKNEIINSGSAKNLQEFIPYVKMLLKLFNDLKTKMVNISSKYSFLKHFYKHKSEEYLIWIRNSILDVNDKELEDNLCLFLSDTSKQVWQLKAKEDSHICLTKIFKIFLKIELEESAKIYQDSYLVLGLEQLLRENKIFLLPKLFSFNEITHYLLIIEFEQNRINELKIQEIQDFFSDLFNVLKEKSNIKIILATKEDVSSIITVNEAFYDKMKKTDDVLTWEHLTDESKGKILEKKIIFQGNMVSLKKLTSVNDNSNLELNLSKDKLNELIDTKTLINLIKNDVINISTQFSTSSYNENFYISRSLSLFTKIKKEILMIKDVPDIFVISTEHRNNLEGLLPNDSSRFFVTNNEEASKKFEGLCECSHENIHWLQYEPKSKSLIWQRSKGCLSVIRQYINDESCTKTLSEDDFLKNESASKVVIISDSAGMGKSTILSHLSQQIKKDTSNSDVWLKRINLNEFTDKLKKLKEHNGIKEHEIKSASKYLTHDLLELYDDSFEKKLLERMISIGKLILMFDGFDEISPVYKDIVIDLLKTLKKSRAKQIWVTTRPNMKAELENELVQFSYILKPFSKEDQVNFLTKFWAQKLNIYERDSKSIIQDRNELESYASRLIDLLNKSTKLKGCLDYEFIAIPLHTKMVAEAFEEDLENVLNSKLEPILNENIDIIGLYEKFFKKKYEIFQIEKNKLDLSKPQLEDNYEKFIDQHLSLALISLFDEDSNILLREKLMQNFKDTNPSVFDICENENKLKNALLEQYKTNLANDIKKGNLNTGIIEQLKEGKPYFIHRNFAEYLVSKLLIKSLNNVKFEILEFLLKQILLNQEYQVIRKFFNFMVSKKKEIENDIFKMPQNKILDIIDENKCNQENIITIAIKEENIQYIKILLENISNSVVIQNMIKKKYEYGKTVLIFGIKTKNLETTKWLVEKGADLNAEDIYGGTVLHYATIKRNLEIVKFLVEKGAVLNAKDIYGGTVLHYASRSENLEIVKFLVDKGADLSAEDESGETVLHYASRSGNLELVKWLVEKGADLNAKERSGETVLHYAWRSRNLELVKWLVEKGADLNAKDIHNKTVLHYASHSGNLELVKWLVEKGADLNAKDIHNKIVLDYASHSGNLELVKWLATKRGELYVKDINDKLVSTLCFE